jgi:hypothetical protein
MTALQYVFGLAGIILRGIASIVLITIGLLLIALIMGNGGPSESFLINFALRIGLFLIGALCLGFGISISVPKSGIFWVEFLKKNVKKIV